MRYEPKLSDDAFVPLPHGVELEGSPSDYGFPLFFMSLTGWRFELEEAAGRILYGLAMHGEWAAVRYHGLAESTVKERAAWQAFMADRDTAEFTKFPHSQMVFPDHADRVRKGIETLVRDGYLGFEERDGEQILWPTPAILEKLQPYRVPQPA